MFSIWFEQELKSIVDTKAADDHVEKIVLMFIPQTNVDSFFLSIAKDINYVCNSRYQLIS